MSLDRLRYPNSGGVEQELQKLQDEANGDPDRKRQLLAVRYYLHDLLTDITNNWLAAVTLSDRCSTWKL